MRGHPNHRLRPGRLHVPVRPYRRTDRHTLGCFFVDGAFTIALQSDGSSVTGPLTGVCCQPGLSGPGGGRHSHGNPFSEDDTITFTSGTGQFSELSGTASFSQSGSGALYRGTIAGTLSG